MKSFFIQSNITRRTVLRLGLVAAITGALAHAGAQTLLFEGGIIHTISGETFSPGKVLVKDGKIQAVGTNVEAAGAEVIHLPGWHVYPGIVALNTVLGLTEISGVRATQDTTESGDYTPDVESWVAVNPDSELIPVSRANGIAYFEPTPLGSVIAGQSGLVSVEGWTTEQRTIKKHVALHLYWPNQELALSPVSRGHRAGGNKEKTPEDQAKERRNKLQAMKDFFEEAKAYAKARKVNAEGGTSNDKIPAWEAMIPYVSGELPITVHADEIRQIRGAIQWAREGNFKIILAGARDAGMVADLIASNKIPVIFAHTFSQPVRDTEPYDVHFKTAALLHKAGVKVAFSAGADSFNAAMARNLPYSAAQSVAFGLPEIEALRGLTLYPAQITGVGDRLGSIEPDKDATLLAVDGNLLDLRVNVKRMWIAGKEISLESRHTRLYEKYRNRPRP